MARFHVYLNRDRDDAAPLLLDVQSDLLSDLPTRVVVPLIPQSQFPFVYRRLQPVMSIRGEPYVLATTMLISVDKRVLGAEVASLEAEHAIIVDALDYLFQGY